MNTNNSATELETARLVVMIERHLQAELGLLNELDNLNQTLKHSLESSGSKGMSPEQSGQLHQLAGQLSAQSDSLKIKRMKTLGAINQNRNDNSTPLSIRLFVQSLKNENDRKRLENLRMAILDRLSDVHAMLVGNQAVMFYSYDFYRKMLAGLLNNDLDRNQYSVTGQTTGVKPGNLFGKAC